MKDNSAVLLVLWVLLLCPGGVLAQESEPSEGTEKKEAPGAGGVSTAEKEAEDSGYVTVVTVRRVDTAAGVSASKIGRRDIVDSGAHDTTDVLEGESSLHAVSGSRGERIFSMRGFSQRQVAVLVDGVPSYIPYDGQVDLRMFPAELVDHISILKGPGSTLYGPNGPGGAVNIVTRRPGTGPLAQVMAETGRSNFLQLRGFHSLEVNEKIAYTVHGGLLRQDSFALSSLFSPQPNQDGVLRTNSDRSAYNLGARVRLTPAARHNLEAGVSFVDGSRGVPPSVAETTPKFWRFSTWRTLNITLAHQGEYLAGLKIDEVLYASLFDNLLDGFDDETYSTQLSPLALHSWYHDQIFGGRIRGRYRFRETPWGPTDVRLWIGVQHDRHEKDLEDGSALFIRQRTIVSLTPEVEARFVEGLSMTVALQVDVEGPSEGQETAVGLGPLLSLRWDPNRDLTLQLTGARRTRFPTLKERFSSAEGYRKPNPELRPENAWNIGLDASWLVVPGLGVQAAVFDAEVVDLIERVYLGGGVDQMQNIGAARLAGMELALNASPLRWLHLKAGYSFLHARRIDEGRGTDLLPYKPAHKATVRLRLAPWRWASLATTLAVVGPQDFEHPETGAWGNLGAYVQWNARLSVRPLPWAEMWVAARNLLDANYQTKFGYPDPGRQVFVGLRLSYYRDSGIRW